MNKSRFKPLLLVLIASVPFWIGIHYLNKRYSLAYDPQPVLQRCLPWQWYLIDKSKRQLADYHYNDFIAIQAPTNQLITKHNKFIKMIAAMPGDLISQHDEHIVANGRTYHQIVNNTKVRPFNLDKPYTVPADHLFVIGDNPFSFDSTYFGPVAQDKIIGKAYALF